MKSEAVKVIKRDGSIEAFDEAKLRRVAIATGISHDNAQEIIQEIVDWAKKEGKVKSTDIRERFSTKLREIRPYSADLYDWYQKIKLNNEDNKQTASKTTT